MSDTSSKANLPTQEFVPVTATRFRFSERTVYASVVIAFVVATGFTIYFSRTMSGGMPMPGHWTMSMMWMVMLGQTQFEAFLMFVAMWLAMMVAMMLPSAFPMLLLYHRAVAFRGQSRVGALTFALAAGYFFAWVLFGVLAYVGGKAVTAAAMTWPAVSRLIPLTAGAALVLAGAYQLTPLKSACLKHCRDPLLLIAHHLHGGWRGAFRLGLHHGAFCAGCCWGLMLIQFVLGVMNLVVMVAVAAIIALEKVLARGELAARITGVAAILGGIWLVVVSLLGA